MRGKREARLTTPDDIIAFWFTECDPKDWWSASPELDRTIAGRFSDIHARLAKGEGFTWRKTPEGRLAEIIVLDQFSRQLYRNLARAFAQDGMALALAQEAVAGGHDEPLPPVRRTFLYMPYMHSESVLVHEAAVPLFAALHGEDDTGKSANDHLDELRRFGRKTKRNAALGRVSTTYEIAYLAEIGNRMF